jgi:hypothetical protein
LARPGFPAVDDPFMETDPSSMAVHSPPRSPVHRPRDAPRRSKGTPRRYLPYDSPTKRNRYVEGRSFRPNPKPKQRID